MSLRLRCRSCQAAFVTSDDQAGQPVDCPKCGTSQVAPKAKPAASSASSEDGEYVESGPALSRIKGTAPVVAPAPKSSVFIAKDKNKKGKESGKSQKGLYAGVLGGLFLIVVGVIAWPAIRDWLDPRPRTMVEAAAYDYLKALKDGDEAAVKRIGVVEDPPGIRKFSNIRREKERDSRLNGNFKTIGKLHRSIEKQFTYDPSIGRFTPKNPLGPAAETLDALHAAKEKAEKNKTYEKMASGDPDESMDATFSFFGDIAKLSDGILSPKRLIPSYKMLIQGAKPPLTGNELALAMDYATHREAWDKLLGRPFPTIKSDGPFAFDRSEVLATVQDKLGSAGDPPVTLRLKLVRFQMDGIDTKWRVVSARRVIPGQPDAPEDEDGPEPQITPEPEKPSPGDAPAIPKDLIPNGVPADLLPK
jgi:DNA-directed RNA polymerase subunit RPC12/RpoP